MLLISNRKLCSLFNSISRKYNNKYTLFYVKINKWTYDSDEVGATLPLYLEKIKPR